MTVSVTPRRSAFDRQRRLATIAMIAPAMLLMLFAFVLPMAHLAVLSFEGDDGPTLANYAELSEPLYRRLVWTTVQLAVLITVVCAVVGFPVAYLIAVVGGRLGRLVAVGLVLTLWLSILTRTYGWIVLLQRRGVLNTLLQGAGITDQPLALVYNATGVVLGMVHLLLPFMVVTLLPTMRSMDPSLIRASLSLGASPARTFFRVYLPLLAPGLVAGSLLVFIMAIGYFVTPAILGGGRTTTIAMAIRNQVQTLVDLPLASATSMALLVLSLVVLVVYERLSGLDRILGRRGG